MIFLLLLFLPMQDVGPTDTVDLVELNHKYDDAAKLEFSQVIYYEWRDDAYIVRSWRIWKQHAQIPTRSHRGYTASWWDGDCLRTIHTKHFRESWTQDDPEKLNEELCPKENRNKLTGER